MKLLKPILLFCLVLTLQMLASGYMAADNTRKASVSTLKIGLLIQDKNSLAALQGAELAITAANRNGGLNGVPFSLAVRSMEGPWGTGSKVAVNLVFDEKVVALLGSHDGRNAHLVEQVSAKTMIPFISAWSGDPTLAQAFIPWYYSCIPNDIQQADAIIAEIYEKRNYKRIIVVSGIDYDSQLAAKSFLKEADLGGWPEPEQLTISDEDKSCSRLTDKIISKDAEAVVILSGPQPAVTVISAIRRTAPGLPVFSSLQLLDENNVSVQDLKQFGNIMVAVPAGFSGLQSSIFAKEFRQVYGKTPGSVAAYAFDAVTLVTEAIKKTGCEGTGIREFMSDVSFKGVTGTIKFDSRGNREGEYLVTELQNILNY